MAKGVQKNWEMMVSGAFLLEQRLARASSEAERVKCVREYLATLEEVFPSSLDPVDDFEAFAARRLIRAVLSGLTRR